MSIRSHAVRSSSQRCLHRILTDAGVNMSKGNKPQKNDKANKKPKSAGGGRVKGAKPLGVTKKPNGLSIFGDSDNDGM
jgi:hypothetical protein